MEFWAEKEANEAFSGERRLRDPLVMHYCSVVLTDPGVSANCFYKGFSAAQLKLYPGDIQQENLMIILVGKDL